MRKVGVIGLGHVGSTVAYTLVTKGIADELVLIDTNEAKCTAEFYDLLDSLGRLDTYTKLSMNDYKALQDADVVITAFGDSKRWLTAEIVFWNTLLTASRLSKSELL